MTIIKFGRPAPSMVDDKKASLRRNIEVLLESIDAMRDEYADLLKLIDEYEQLLTRLRARRDAIPVSIRDRSQLVASAYLTLNDHRDWQDWPCSDPNGGQR